MTNHLTQRTTCRLCHGSDPEPILAMEPTPPGDHYLSAEHLGSPQTRFPLTLALCRQCGYVGLLHTVDPDLLYGAYTYNTRASLGLDQHYRLYADQILDRFHPPAGTLVVEIGSNDGTFLDYFQKAGLKALGVDPAAEPSRTAAVTGLDILSDYFSARCAQEIRATRGPAGLILANMVLANVDDLIDLVEGIRILLDKQGVFVFETGYLGDLHEHLLIDNIYHEHLSYFSVGPLARFFRRQGLELFDVFRNDSKGGSIRCFVQQAGGPNPVSSRVQEQVAEEAQTGLADPKTWQPWADRIANVGQKLEDCLAKLHTEGKTIAGFGASVGVTTLMYQFGLNRYLSFLVDDNPVKQGAFSPGHHLPVYGAEAMYREKPDAMVVMAWRFARPIMSNHQRYLDAGGQFIIPLPALKVIDLAHGEGR